MPPHFTDRENDLSALADLHGRFPELSTPLIVVSGPAGIGKTALVSRWLRGMTGRFPDGQLYADLRGHSETGPADPGDVMGQFLRALGVVQVPHGLDERAALWRSVTDGLHVSIMLDNVLSAAQARPLLPGGRHCLVVVTSRYRLTGLRADGALHHELGLLEQDAAVEILTLGIGAERVRREGGAVHQVVSLCAGLPLAVCLASARLASRPRQPVRTMAEALAQDRGRLAALAVEGELSVYAALDESYAVLTPEAARLYRRLALLPARQLDSRLAAVALRVPLGEAERLLDVLVEANLLEDTGPDAYRFHDLVRLHAEERGRAEESPAAQEETSRRVGDWHLHTASAAQKLLSPIQFTLNRTYVHEPTVSCPFADESGALTWLETRRADLMATVRTADEKRWDTLAWQLVDALWPLFHRLRHYDLWIEAHEIGRRAARRDGDRTAERQMLNSGAIGLNAAGRTDDAIDWFTQSLRAAREAGDTRDEGQALLGIGAAHREAGRFQEAEVHLHRAISTWQTAGYGRGVALARIILGEIALEDVQGERSGGAGGAGGAGSAGGAGGPAERAAELFAQAHEALVALNDPYDAARALAFSGRVSALTGPYDTAAERLGEALRFFASAGSAHWQARVSEMLGTCAHEHSLPDTAREHWERARSLYALQSPSDARRVGDLLAGLSGARRPVDPADPREERPTDPSEN
ncbi:tetratricopeptide repeat protein [Streptomyces paromomycinus]|uniref:tetratricopeptide repeat protein n=1 Tax=Streptomyces paromomycinus TaxID=92743 RepID=UPI000F61862A|nr:tetratricopeptide repeat protein [Streptomyces paromomycinus]